MRSTASKSWRRSTTIRAGTRTCSCASASAQIHRKIDRVQTISIRPARPDERTTLEALQWRASLNNEGDREALLANPDAIALPIEQIATGCVFVAEIDGSVAGFAAVVPRSDGGAELDA